MSHLSEIYAINKATNINVSVADVITVNCMSNKLTALRQDSNSEPAKSSQAL